MKYFDAFSGYGGFSLGIQKSYENSRMDRNRKENHRLSGGQEAVNGSGVGDKQAERPSNESHKSTPTCVGFSEIDRYAIETYSKHFPEHKNYGSITDIDANTLPDFDLFVGGFPCQAFSIAGKRAGFEDTRGTLIYDVFRIIKEKHPRLVLLENVKGLLSHDGGRTFKTIITALAELGYAVEWQVLNAKNFGVPQNRERVFIIGHLGGFSGRQVFPIGGTNTETNTPKEFPEPISNCLRTNYSNGKSNETYIRKIDKKGKPKKDQDNAATLTGGGHSVGNHSGMTIICKPVLTPDRPTKRQNGRRMKEDGDPSFTLTAQDKHGIYDGMKIRRLTPTECERLMGLPDGWLDGISDTQKYKLAGNGVVVNVVEEIVKRLT